MRHTLSCAAGLAMIWLSLSAAQTTASKKTTAPPKKTTAAPAAKKSVATAAHKGTTAGKKSVAKRPAVTWRNRQMAPSPERYHEIQDALVTRGFLTSEQATGGWNDASVDALKRFQAQQNLESSGKINSLSLIALGLG